jgi:serine/threonine protein kinase
MRELSLNNTRLDGRYDIREQLGRGSYAEIYVARDTLAAAAVAEHSGRYQSAQRFFAK